MPKVEIDIDKPLQPGDRVDLHFKSTGLAWIKAAQIALLENRLAGRKDFNTIGITNPADQPRLLIFHIEIMGSPPPPPGTKSLVVTTAAALTAAKIAVIIGALGLFYLTLSKAYLIVKEFSLTGKGPGGIGLGLVAAVIAGIYLLTKK